jgi:hypothetical protein
MTVSGASAHPFWAGARPAEMHLEAGPELGHRRAYLTGGVLAGQ